MSDSKYYFYADFTDGDKIVRGVPVLGIHVGDNDAEPWDSGEIKSGIEFKNTFERLHEQAPPYLALPMIFSWVVAVGSKWERVSITGFEPKHGQKIRVGPVFVLTLRDATVAERSPIHGLKVPKPPPIQRTEIQRTLGIAGLSKVIEVGFAVGEPPEISM